MKTSFVVLSLVQLFLFSLAEAAPSPSDRHVAGASKTGQYISSGFFVGGDPSVTAAKLVDIRRAKSPAGYERIVLDLADSNKNEAKGKVPHFQLHAAPNEGRLVLSIWADVAYDFDPPKIRKAFAKSGLVRKLNIVPRVEDGLAIIEFDLKPRKGVQVQKVEAFHLDGSAPAGRSGQTAAPARIILDLIS